MSITNNNTFDIVELPHVVVPLPVKEIKDTLETLIEKKVEWSNENEKILVEWGDIAACNKWLHTESCKLFTRRNAYFTIPIIVISTITGALSFIASGFDRRQTSSYLQLGWGRRTSL
jgi:hypothetical protein